MVLDHSVPTFVLIPSCLSWCHLYHLSISGSLFLLLVPPLPSQLCGWGFYCSLSTWGCRWLLMGLESDPAQRSYMACSLDGL